MDLYAVVDNLPEEVSKVSVYVGNERQNLDQVFSFDNLPEVQDIQSKLIDEGFGTEFKYARLIFRDDKGKQLKSHSMRKAIVDKTNDLTPALTSLVNGFLNMQRNYERVFDMLARGANDSANREKKLRDELLEMQYELMAAKTDAAALDIKAQEEDDRNGPWDRIADVVTDLGGIWLTKDNMVFSPNNFLSEVEANPQILDSFMTDKRVVAFLKDKISSVSPGPSVSIKEGSNE